MYIVLHQHSGIRASYWHTATVHQLASDCEEDQERKDRGGGASLHGCAPRRINRHSTFDCIEIWALISITCLLGCFLGCWGCAAACTTVRADVRQADGLLTQGRRTARTD